MKESFYLNTLALKLPQDLLIDEKTDWVKKILEELNEEVDSEDINGETSYLKLDLELIRDEKDALGDYLLINGEIDTQYLAYCVKTYDVIECILKTEIDAVILHKEMETKLQLDESTSLFIDDRDYEVFYYDKQIELAPVIHEFIFLNKDPYPQKEKV